MSTEIELLESAKDFINRGWCQGQFALDEYTEPVKTIDPSACKWCSSGAIWAAAGMCAEGTMWSESAVSSSEVHTVVKALDSVEAIICDDITEWNDVIGRTKEEVLEVFDEAINMLRTIDDS